MIQAITESTFKAVVQTLDNQIPIGDNYYYIWKFSNDMGGQLQYAYARKQDVFNRYGNFYFDYNLVPDVFTGKVDLVAGYWKYEVYQVTWDDGITIAQDYAPITENDILLPPAGSKGVVRGLITKGKMYVSEKAGTEQITYNQHQSPTGTNYIWNGQ